ncbi:MAG: hypothetical protein ACM3SW_08380 [Actinomycetota bacterium]
MKLSTRIAAARRQLCRMQEDYPLFLKRIKDHTPEQTALAIYVYEDALADSVQNLEDLERERQAEPF